MTKQTKQKMKQKILCKHRLKEGFYITHTHTHKIDHNWAVRWAGNLPNRSVFSSFKHTKCVCTNGFSITGRLSFFFTFFHHSRIVPWFLCTTCTNAHAFDWLFGFTVVLRRSLYSYGFLSWHHQGTWSKLFWQIVIVRFKYLVN